MPSDFVSHPDPNVYYELPPLPPPLSQRPSPSSPSSSSGSDVFGFAVKVVCQSLFLFVVGFIAWNYYNKNALIYPFIEGVLQAIPVVFLGVIYMKINNIFPKTTDEYFAYRQLKIMDCRSHYCILAAYIGLFCDLLSMETSFKLFYLSPIWNLIHSQIITAFAFTVTDVIAATCTYSGLLLLLQPGKVVLFVNLCTLSQVVLGAYRSFSLGLFSRPVYFMFIIYAMAISCTVTTFFLGDALLPAALRNQSVDEKKDFLSVMIGAMSVSTAYHILNFRGIPYHISPGDVLLWFLLCHVFLNVYLQESISICGAFGSSLLILGCLLTF